MVPRIWRRIRYRYNVIASYCESCGSYYYPQREICPKCRRKGIVKETEMDSEGTVLSYTVVNGRKIALIEFKNGTRMLAEVCGDIEIRMQGKKGLQEIRGRR